MGIWYKRFIPNFSELVEPFTRLTRKNVRFEWGEEALKTALTTAPILAHPRFELPFTLQTDACTTGLGALLTQENDGEEKIIACGSRSLSKAERNYSATELECLTVIWAVEKYRQYLEGTHFTVITDHSSLRWLKNLRDPTGRLARWAMRLAQHDMEIIHRKGTLHQLPDALSRFGCEKC